MSKFNITQELRDSINFLRNGFGLEVTLSEIFALRRYLIEDSTRDKTTSFQEGASPHIEAVARLFKDYYEIDYWDLYSSEDGKPIPGSLCTPVSEDALTIRNLRNT